MYTYSVNNAYLGTHIMQNYLCAIGYCWVRLSGESLGGPQDVLIHWSYTFQATLKVLQIMCLADLSLWTQVSCLCACDCQIWTHCLKTARDFWPFQRQIQSYCTLLTSVLNVLRTKVVFVQVAAVLLSLQQRLTAANLWCWVLCSFCVWKWRLTIKHNNTWNCSC